MKSLMYWKVVIIPLEGKGGGVYIGIIVGFCVFFRIDETSRIEIYLPYANY